MRINDYLDLSTYHVLFSRCFQKLFGGFIWLVLICKNVSVPILSALMPIQNFCQALPGTSAVVWRTSFLTLMINDHEVLRSSHNIHSKIFGYSPP